MAALSAFEDEVLELDERDRELRSAFATVSLVAVVVESPSSRPDSVTDSNLEPDFFLKPLPLESLFLDFSDFLLVAKDFRSLASSNLVRESLSLSGGPTISSPGTLPLRKIPLTVRFVAVATLLADGCGGAVDVDE